MDCRLLLIVSLIVPVSSAITESHQQLRANSVGTITRTGTGCSTLQHASLLQIQENTDPGIPLFNITGVSDLYFMENHDGFELEKTENQSIWLIKANRSFDFESLPKQQNIGFKVHCEDSTQNGPYTVGIFVTDVYEPVNITLIASSDNFNISSTDSPVIVSVPEYTVISTPILYIAAETSIPIQEELHWTPTNNSIVEVKFAEGTSMIFLNLLKELEYKEDNHLYPITVGTEVDGHPDSNQAMQVTINVTDVDDKNPKFDRPHYTGFIRENAASNTQVTLNEALKARDQDFGINARINYEIPFTDSVYNINPSSGVISLKGGHSLDRENISVFTLVVRACQEDKPEFRCDVATVEISITDVNDNAPVMSQASYTASIPENMKNGQVVTWVNATDADEGPNAEFEYTLENCTKSFKIAQNGSIIVKNSTQLDMEKTKKFNCTVYAKESKTAEKKSSKRSSLTIYLTDVNDNNPKFTNTSYRFTVTDNPTEHTAIGQVNAKDADVLKSTNGNVTYELSVQKENLFEINDRTGELHSLDNPLYACKRSTKLPKSVVLAVTAADSPEDLETKRRTTVSVTVNIQTNLCPPVLSVVGNNVSDHSIPEDILPGSLLLTIQVFDADPDDSSLFFDISGDHEPFQLNKTSKNNMVQLSVSSALDRERKEHYSFTVQANDTKHVISRNFTFDITDVNDNAPVFSQQKYSVNVTEETTQNTNLTVQATDKDLQNTDNSKITYTLVSSKWSNKFTIDASSGALNLVKKIDADEMGSNKTLELVVIAKDQGIPSLNCTALIHVTVEDINDHAPVFSEAPQNLTFTFNETDQPQHFFTVKATDKDTDDKVFYKLTNATEAFYIDNRTGQLSAKRDLQRSDIGVVVIEAYNVKNYSNKTIQNPKLFIEINIKDINNNSPVFTPNSYAKNISEGSPVGSEIGSVKANDSDWSEEFGSVYYWITDGNSEGHFFLNELNGTLYLANHTDYEKETKYNLTITASDSRELSQTITNHSTTASFVINILDVNDNSPKFTQDLYQCSVKESTLDFDCQVKAEDKDVTTDFKQIDYQLVNGSDSKFQITGDGEITLNQTMDYDTGDHSFILTVKATDRNDSSLASTCNVMITVNNTNDEEPEFQQKEYKFSVGENQDSGTEVGVVRAMDRDSDSVLLYSMDPENKNFSINSTSGIITTLEKFDYESKSSYNFTVNVSDGNHTNTTSVYVEIRDMNDNAPAFNASVYTAYIPENDIDKVILKNISAHDADKGQTVTYTLENYKELFSINSTTGVLSLMNDKKTLDYESQRTYVLSLTAKDDGDPPLSGEATVEVQLTDVDDTCPVFTRPVYRVTIKENTTYPSILQVSAQDNDTSPNKLVYKVKNNDKFTFNGSKLVLKENLDVDNYQPTVINVTVTVTDNSILNCSNTSIIQVTVENINDNPPVINTSSCVQPIAQNFSGTVCSVSATDADLNSGNFTFFLTQSYGIFSIETNTGELSVLPNQTLKANFTYNVNIVVSDHGSPPLMRQDNINIFVNAANNFPPVFSNKTVTVDVEEHLMLPYSVYNMTATDQDSGKEGEIRYKLVKEDSAFKINQLTGEITLNTSLKCDRPNKFYTLKVEAKDQGFNPMSSAGIVTVRVINVNDKPEFIDIDFSVCVNPPIEVNTSIAKVIAKDTDSVCTGNETDDQITYSLIDPKKNFKINDQGEIMAAKNITSQSFIYSLEIVATDVHGLNNSKSYNISSGQKGEPVIKPKVTEVSIFENHTINTTITKINATGDGEISYSITKTSKLRDAFRIDTKTGEISLIHELDREMDGNLVEMIIEASNKNGSCTSQVIIHIKDVNNKSPYFVGIPYKHQIKENSSETDQCILNISAMDPDLNNQLIFSIVNATLDVLDVFNISTNNGEPNQACLQINRALDAETDPNDISLWVEVSDGIHHSNLTEVKVTVLDINDNWPKFNKSYSFNVSEGVSLGRLKSDIISAYDRDGLDKNKLRYAIISNDSQSLPFELDPQSGVLSVVHKLDRETKEAYSLDVTVHDSWKNHTVSTFVNITVLDINDNTPTFVNKTMRNSVLEGSDSKQLTIPLTVTDPDSGENGTVTFTLVNNYDGHFKLENESSHTAQITVVKELDREAKGILITSNGSALYTLEVVAADQGKPSLSSTGTVQIYVSDINDCTPEFEKTNMRAEVMEGSKEGFSVYRVTATDCDYNPDYKNLTYRISGVDQEYFSIEKDVYGDFQVGVIKLKKQISIDIKETYVININVTDGVNSNQTSLTVTVVDVNDHDPEFSEPLYNFLTPETDNKTQGDPVRIRVGQVNATDKDPFKNGEITYRIVTSDVENLFNITQDGEVFLIGEVDRDQCTNHKYTFTVIAEDEGSPKRMGFTEVVVNITDVNDNSPVFKKTNYTGSIKENSHNGSSVLFNPSISAEDDDEAINGTAGIRFFITSSDAAELPFTIDNTTGRILVNNSAILDRETKSNYTIKVEARDRLGRPGCKSNTTNVKVNVLDANDNPPQFTNTSYSFSVLEDAGYGELVGSVTAHDLDLGSELTYYIISGGDGHFSINDKTSGNITVSNDLDREIKANYSLVVRVTDEKYHRNVTVLIILKDVNDNSPVFSSSLLRVNETEERNVSYPKQIFTLKATDADEGMNAEIKYFLNISDSVPASNITKLFTLNKTGELFLHRKLDREEKDRYSLPVYAMDGGNRITPATVEVLVQDINDNDPVFYNHDNVIITNYSASVLEMSPINSIIYLPVCRDVDKGENGTISFTLRSQIPSVNDLLAIDPGLGTVSIKSPISVNSLIHITNGTDQNNLIHITNGTDQTVFLTYIITASDGGYPPHSTNFTLELVVKNINDNAPVFEKPRYNFSIPENVTANTAVGDIKAFVVNETFYHLTYSMIEQADASFNFTVTSEGKVFTKRVLDRETKGQVTFAARVVDGRVPERTAFTVVAITLEDVNDNSPSFEKSDYQYTVIENDVNPPPLIVKASDRDEGENAQLTYSLIGDTGGKFVLNGTTGTLRVNGSLDREVEPYFYLQIKAIDKGYPQLSSVVNVTVRVSDVNDHSPKFDSSQLSRNISENLSGIQTIATVRADDPDAGLNGTVVYELEDDHGLFQIDSLNGTVFCTRPLDYEEQDVYNLTITATDMGSPPRISHTNLVLYVTDVPDNRPTFSNTLYKVNVSISDSVGKSLLNLTAGGRTSYTITGGNQENRFSLNKDTGEVKVQRSFAHGQAEYLLSVEAKDTDSNLTATTRVLVNVVDLATVSSSVPHYTASLMENNKETVVVFNLTSRDQYGAGMEYRIVRTDPPVAIGYFYITSGQVYCNQSVDRETISLIKLHIESTEIQLSQGRKKRSARTGDIILEVNIGDENDNPPSFSVANGTDSLVFGVPSGAQPGDLVGVIKAIDPDSVSAGKVRYNISGGDMSQFYVYPTTGQIVVRQALYRDPRTDYTLRVTATDEDGKNDTANVTVLVVPSSSSMILIVPFANNQMMSHKQNLAQKLSELIGYKCEFEKTTTHTENNRIEPCRTDVILHCIDPAKNFVVPKYLVQGIIQNKSQEVTALFCRAIVDFSPCGGCDDVTVQRIPLKHSSKISTTEIALIVIGALILIGGSAAIALILASPQKDEEDRSDKQPHNNVDVWELESMAASSLSKATGAAAGVVNPMFTSQEVENSQTSPTAEAEIEEQSNSEKNTTRKRSTSYESQEVILDFQEDVIDDDGNHQINHSNADSGVENESDSSHSGSIQTVNEMEASGGPSEGGAEGGIEIKEDSYETSSPGNERKSIFITMETGDTTDDEISYDGSIASGGDQGTNEGDSVDGGVRAEEMDMAEESSNQACNETGELSKPSSGVKSVTFKPGPPVVEEYEALEDEVTCL